MSVVLYRDPVWAQEIATDGVIRRAAARLQRQLELRIIRGYRTVLYEAALLLARLVPFDILANRLKWSYLKRRALIERDGFVAPRAMSHIRDDEWRRSIVRWRKRLEELPRDAPGAAVRGALVERLSSWMARAHGGPRSLWVTVVSRLTYTVSGGASSRFADTSLPGGDGQWYSHPSPLSLVGCGEEEHVRGSRSGSGSRSRVCSGD